MFSENSRSLLQEVPLKSEKITGRDILFGPFRYDPFSPWGPLLAILLVLLFVPFLFVVFLLVSIEGGIVLGFLGYAGPDVGDLVSRFIIRASDLANYEAWVVGIAIQLLAIVYISAVASRKGAAARVLRLDVPQPSWPSLLIVAAGIAVAYIAFSFVIEAATGIDGADEIKEVLAGLRGEAWWLVVVAAVIMAPLSEELVFRGFLLSSLSQTSLGYWPSALLCNAAWTALHFQYGYVGLAMVFSIGLVLSWLMSRTGSMRVVIVVHGVINALVMALVGILYV